MTKSHKNSAQLRDQLAQYVAAADWVPGDVSVPSGGPVALRSALAFVVRTEAYEVPPSAHCPSHGRARSISGVARHRPKLVRLAHQRRPGLRHAWNP
jgi:hypothetical protein